LKRYEAMFLFDNAAMHQWSEIEGEVKRLFDRIEAQPLVCLKFDERRLAYEINGRKRGTYVLTYFDADPGRIADLERDAGLSESVLRMLVLRADKISEEKLAELKALPPDQPLQPAASESRRGDSRRDGGRGRYGDRKPEESKPAAESKPAGETKPAETPDADAAQTATATATTEAPADQPATTEPDKPAEAQP